MSTLGNLKFAPLAGCSLNSWWLQEEGGHFQAHATHLGQPGTYEEETCVFTKLFNSQWKTCWVLQQWDVWDVLCSAPEHGRIDQTTAALPGASEGAQKAGPWALIFWLESLCGDICLIFFSLFQFVFVRAIQGCLLCLLYSLGQGQWKVLEIWACPESCFAHWRVPGETTFSMLAISGSCQERVASKSALNCTLDMRVFTAHDGFIHSTSLQLLCNTNTEINHRRNLTHPITSSSSNTYIKILYTIYSYIYIYKYIYILYCQTILGLLPARVWLNFVPPGGAMLRQPGMWGQWASPMHVPFGHAPYTGSWPQSRLPWRANLSLEDDDLGLFRHQCKSLAIIRSWPPQEGMLWEG